MSNVNLMEKNCFIFMKYNEFTKVQKASCEQEQVPYSARFIITRKQNRFYCGANNRY